MADDAKTYNMNIGGLVDRANRFLQEMQKSQASNLTSFNVFDQGRLTSYLDSLEAYIDWVVAQPMLDLPETSPREVKMNTFPEIQEHENPMITDVVRLIERFRDELMHSQSSRQSTGLVSFDEVRARKIIEALRTYLADYVSKVNPVDLPETTPSEETTGSGKTGV